MQFESQLHSSSETSLSRYSLDARMRGGASTKVIYHTMGWFDKIGAQIGTFRHRSGRFQRCFTCASPGESQTRLRPPFSPAPQPGL